MLHPRVFKRLIELENVKHKKLDEVAVTSYTAFVKAISPAHVIYNHFSFFSVFI